ncbi:hypothetical protein B296_00028281 [Ensete ventricosum]|uniref:HMA domain-containing protein n=1 Tax=Ensete ventricosum TaxID=4639 RepID=A0A427AHJ5_ENSVE|nr:hypothetical protein B296_00028281 [Ensete ventricosum]
MESPPPSVPRRQLAGVFPSFRFQRKTVPRYNWKPFVPVKKGPYVQMTVPRASHSCEKEKKGDREKKKRGGTVEEVVEVKLDMHCKGCAQKVRKAVKRLEGNNTLSIPLPFFPQSREEDSQFTSTFHRVPAGMEAVSVDPANNRLKAIGKVDPWKLKEFLEAKTKKKVDFISPKDPPKKPKGDEMKKKDEDAKDRDQKNSSDDKKPKPVSNWSTH